MFFIDDVLASPVKALVYILREIHKAVQQDAANEAESIRAQMSELYMLLETGQITEEEADAREKELLDRLDELELQQQNAAANIGEEEEEEEEDEEEEEEQEQDADDDASLAAGTNSPSGESPTTTREDSRP